MSTPIINQTAGAPALPGSGSGNGDGATITQSPTIVAATLANGDNIAYSRPTMSYEVASKGRGYAIFGYGNGAFGVDDEKTNSIVAISPTKDVTLQKNGATLSLGNLQDPQTQSRLSTLLTPDAYADLKSAMATKNLSNTTIAQEFSAPTIESLTSVQSQDISLKLGQNHPQVAPPPAGNQVSTPDQIPPSAVAPAAMPPYPSAASPYAGGYSPNLGYGQSGAASVNGPMGGPDAYGAYGQGYSAFPQTAYP